MTVDEKLDRLLGMAEKLTNEVVSLRQHVMSETNDHDRRIRRLELRAFDTEPAPAPNDGVAS
jgi:hypothetical protein